ncbi:glycosyl hydrolase family 28-related protein [Streptomyces sp. NPDC001941]|uniref:glycosyl hydrolase family 28-related protein n=1 Tax=Streptomyces sp. NPDC001941 TaxID=3154659 RepID=UPI00332C6D1D
MARNVFGGTAADVAEDSAGARVPGVTGTVWDGPSDGAAPAAITDLGGAPLTGLTADDNGMIGSFLGPESAEVLWVDFGAGRVAISSSTVGERLRGHLTADDPHGDRAAALDTMEAQKGVAGGLASLDLDGYVPPSQLPSSVDWISVKARRFGARGNGTADDTAAIQAAVNAAKAARTVLYIPAGTYLVSAPITIPVGEGLTIQGAGWGSVIKVKGGSNVYAFKMTGEDTRITMRDLKIDGNCLEQNAPSGGIYAPGAVSSLFENIHFTFCWEDALYLGPMTSGAFGHNNKITNCLFDQSMSSTGPGRGIHMTANDENQILACDFEFLGGMGGTGFGTAVCILDRAGTQMIVACNFVGGASNNTRGVRLQDCSNTKITGCNFDGTGGDSIFIAGTQNMVTSTSIFGPGEVGTAGQASAIHLEYGTAHNQISGNTLATSTTDGRTRSLIREEAMGNAGPNLIVGNVLVAKGRPAVGLTELEGAGTVVRDLLGTAGSTSTRTSGIHVPEGWGRFWRARRDDPSSLARVAVVGGNIAQGLYATNLETGGTDGLLRTALQARYGRGGSGFYSVTRSSSFLSSVGVSTGAVEAWTARGCLVGQSGTWTVGTGWYGPGASYLVASASASLTFRVTGSVVRVYTLTGAKARANWTYKVDNAAPVAVTDTNPGTLGIQVTTITGLSDSEHTVTVAWAGTAAQTLSVCGVSAELPSGVLVDTLARPGAKAEVYADPAPAALNATWNGGRARPADLVIAVLATEDAVAGTPPDTWATSLTRYLSAVKEASQGATDVLLVLPHVGRADPSYLYQAYATRACGIAETYGAALVDFWTLGRNSYDYWASLSYWGNTAVPGQPGTDSVHPSDLGHSYMASTILPLLTS